MKDNGTCYYCGKATNNLSGNPGMWPVFLPHEDDPGRSKPHHEACVLQRLREGDQAIALLKKYHTTPVPAGRWEAIGHFLSNLKR